MSNSTQRKVAIIGAGLAGTTAGLGLVEAGFDLTIYSDRDRNALNPAVIHHLDRIAGDYTRQGWSQGRSSGACALGKLRLLEIRWRTVRGEAAKGVVLWQQEAAGFEEALKAVQTQPQQP